MKVAVGKGSPLGGKLHYSHEEYSFRFESSDPVELGRRCGGLGITSLSIGTLQLEVGVESKELLYIWGYHPYAQWEKTRLEARGPVKNGRIRIIDFEALEPGVSIDLAGTGEWRTQFDESSNIVRVGSHSKAEDILIKIANGVSIGIKNTEVYSFWLTPVFDDQPA